MQGKPTLAIKPMRYRLIRCFKPLMRHDPVLYNRLKILIDLLVNCLCCSEPAAKRRNSVADNFIPDYCIGVRLREEF